MNKRHHLSTYRRAQQIAAITDRHYERENRARCLAQVWRHHIYPRYGISYYSYLRLLHLARQSPEETTVPEPDKPIFSLLGV